MEATLQSIFRDGFGRYKEQHGMSMDQHRAAQAIMACQSDELGYETWCCPNDDHTETHNHSCKHRSCPRCYHAASHDWLEKTKSRLLPCDHYHVIFTLPHELNPIWHYNRHWCSDHLHKASTETLRQLLKDERYLGAEVGMISSLHTWGRTLSFHPHVHVLITGGGLGGETWKAVNKDFLLPVGVLKAKFRGKWLSWLNAAYDSGDLQLPPDWTPSDWKKVLRQIARKDWNVRIQGAYHHANGVAVYLSRYVKGGPIKDHSLIDMRSDRVTFRYLDYRDTKTKTIQFSSEHFISRVLWHVPVKGQHNVRYYGLYVPGAAGKREVARQLLGYPLQESAIERQRKERVCPICGSTLVHCSSARRKISYIRSIRVQQAVRADLTGFGSCRSLSFKRIFLPEQRQLN